MLLSKGDGGREGERALDGLLLVFVCSCFRIFGFGQFCELQLLIGG